MQLFSHILDVMLVTDQSLITSIVDNLLSTSAKIKRRYGSLSICIKKIGTDLIFKLEPQFLHNLIEGLSINHMVSSVTSLFKSVVKSLFESEKKVDFDLNKWQAVIGDPLVQALLHQSSTIHHNAVLYWVPVNLHLHASVFPKLLQLIYNSRSDSSIDTLNKCLSSKRLAALIGILKVARECGLMEMDKSNLDVIQQAISSFNEDIRANGFSVICKVSKLSNRITDDEFNILYQHIPLNMNVDSAGFRNEFLSCMKVFLTHIHCSLVFQKKQVGLFYQKISIS